MNGIPAVKPRNRLDPHWYACPKCGVDQGERCRTTSGTNRVTDTHISRWDLVDLYIVERDRARILANGGSVR